MYQDLTQGGGGGDSATFIAHNGSNKGFSHNTHQLDFITRNSKQQVDGFVGEMT
jgi:hypothetical protein